MIEQSFSMTVSDGTVLEAKLNQTDRKHVVGLIHIFHGMAEHFHRYNRLVTALNEAGYDVLRHHHQGHGIHIDETTRGHIDSFKQAATDAYEIYQTLSSKYAHVPYIVLGHSMGSLIARRYIEQYSEVLDGLILTGTPQYPLWMARPARRLLDLIIIMTGKSTLLPWLNQIVYHSFNKKIKPHRTSNDWLDTNPEHVDRFENDPYTGFLVSNQLIYETLDTMIETSAARALERIDHNIPILLMSGEEDPVSNYGKGVKHLYREYIRAGFNDITVQLYPNKCHEILFDDSDTITWQHLFEWLKAQQHK